MKYIVLCFPDDSMALIDCLHGEMAKVERMSWVEFDGGVLHWEYSCKPFARWFDSLDELANEFVRLNGECVVVE
jgi:hypothetical protein